MTADTAAIGRPGEESEVSRREFLNYAWLASLGILVLETGVLTYQFAMPRLGPGEFGGPVDIGPVESLPSAGLEPEPFNKAKFWWVTTADGALALYKVCTHLGCIFDWKSDQGKFICPCHGSQFTREGELLTGPAPRSLDRMVITARDGSGAVVAETGPDGAPVRIPERTSVVVDTGRIIKGPSA